MLSPNIALWPATAFVVSVGQYIYRRVNVVQIQAVNNDMIRCPPVSASWHMFTLSKLAYASKDRLISVPALWFVESRRFGDRHQLSSLAVRSTHQHYEHTVTCANSQCAQINQSNMKKESLFSDEVDNYAVKDCTLCFNVDSSQVSDAEPFLRYDSLIGLFWLNLAPLNTAWS